MTNNKQERRGVREELRELAETSEERASEKSAKYHKKSK